MKRNKTPACRLLLASSLAALAAGCGAPTYELSDKHITAEQVAETAPVAAENIPRLVRRTPALPELTLAEGADTFSVVVNKVDVEELLFALARDAGVDMDVDSRVGGIVSLNAIDETLDGILERIAAQVNIRVDRRGDTLLITPDEPYFKQYSVEYINLDRGGSSSSSIGALGDGGGGSGSAEVSNSTEGSFWDDLEEAIEAILDVSYQEGDSSANEAVSRGESRESRFAIDASSFTIHRNTGIIIVYASDRQHRQIQELLDRVVGIAKRQVLLEATVVEVRLANNYKQGIDWAVFNEFAEDALHVTKGGGLGAVASFVDEVTEGREVDQLIFSEARAYQVAAGLFGGEVEVVTDENNEDRILAYRVTGSAHEVPAGGEQPSFGYLRPHAPDPDRAFSATFKHKDLTAAVDLLSQFGNTRVVSSPRVSILNNQIALLKVVDTEVYFQVTQETEEGEDGEEDVTRITTDVNEIPVGFVMNVLPQISEDGSVMLNLRPSITRVIGEAVPPPGANISNVPIIRTSELESLIALRDGEVAVLGGLLEDLSRDNNTGVPGLNKLPGLGGLFENKDERSTKSEWVVFIRAKVVKNPSLYGDYSDYSNLLPDVNFLRRKDGNTPVPPQQIGK